MNTPSAVVVFVCFFVFFGGGVYHFVRQLTPGWVSVGADSPGGIFVLILVFHSLWHSISEAPLSPGNVLSTLQITARMRNYSPFTDCLKVFSILSMETNTRAIQQRRRLRRRRRKPVPTDKKEHREQKQNIDNKHHPWTLFQPDTK